MECKHLIKYDGRRIEIPGFSFMGFEVGSSTVEPKLLQAVSETLMLIDASQYHLCEMVSNAPDDETRKKYYELMMEDQLRAQDIIRGLMGLRIKPDSKQVEEAMIQMLLENHKRALEIEEQKIKVTQEVVEASSPNTIEIDQQSLKDRMMELEKSYSSRIDFQKVKSTKTPETDFNVLHSVLSTKLDLEEFRDLCGKLNVDYDNLRGEGKAGKARELILYLKRRDRLVELYDLLTDYLAKRD